MKETFSTRLLSQNRQSSSFPREADSDLSTARGGVQRLRLPSALDSRCSGGHSGQGHWSLLLQRFQRIHRLPLHPNVLSLLSPGPCDIYPHAFALCPLDPQLSLPSAASTRSNQTSAWRHLGCTRDISGGQGVKWLFKAG